MRIALIGLFCAALAVAAGCAADETPTEDDLAGDSELDGEALGKADGPDSTFTFFQIEQDFRKCVFPLCGGKYVSRVNRAYTRCGDGYWRDRCYVTGVDLTDTKLSDKQQGDLDLASDKILVRGSLGSVSFDNFGTFDQLNATEVWRGGSDNPADGLFTRVRHNGIVCITFPCPGAIIESKVNSVLSAELAELDLSYTGLSDEDIEAARAHVFDDDGLIVSGYRYWFWDQGWQRGRLAIQFFERILPEPAAAECMVAGCSGQLCVDPDIDPIYTTCEWLPHYACYQSATCERQADGACGFTETDELLECLADPPQPD